MAETTEIKPDLVLGIAQDYSFERLKPFVISLKQSGYGGEIIFFCHRLRTDTRENLKKKGIKIIPFYNFRSQKQRKFFRDLFNRLAHSYYQYKWPFYRWAWPWLLAAAKLRYYLYLRFLTRFEKHYGRVLLTDVRDVFFQRSPFQDYPGQDLVFFEEDHRLHLRRSSFNSYFIQSLLGQTTLDRLGDRVTLCSGTIMGKPAALIHYLKKYLALLQTAQNLDSFNGDQAIHNAIVYEHLSDIPFSIFIAPNIHGPVYTMAFVPEAEIKLSGKDEVLFPDGRVAPILHQYDRFPKIASKLIGKTRDAV